MRSRDTPPVLRQTQPEIYTDGARNRRGRRLGVSVVVVIAAVALVGWAAAMWH